MWVLILFGLELFFFSSLYGLARPRYIGFVNEHRKSLSLAIMAPVSLWLLDKLQVAERLAEPLSRVHQLMVGLYGSKSALLQTKCFMVKNISLGMVVLMGTTLLTWAAEGNAELLFYGVCLICLIPFALYKELAGRLQKKKRQMLLELPEVINQIVLLVNAGETVQKALLRCVERNNKAAVDSSPLLTELSQAAYQVSMNASFAKAMEDFSKRCSLQEVSLFTTTLLLNYKRGGNELVMSLKELSTVLWEKRKSLAKTLGEEASSKMVFPMVLIFLVVMIVVASPAVIMMSH